LIFFSQVNLLDMQHFSLRYRPLLSLTRNSLQIIQPKRSFHVTFVALKRKNHAKSGNYLLTGKALQFVEENIKPKTTDTPFITEELLIKSSEDIEPMIREEITTIVKQFSDKNIKELDLKTDIQLKFNILRAVMKRFGREIPNNALPNMIKVDDIIKFYIDLIEFEKPKPVEKLPDNVKLFLKHAKRHVREENEKNAFPSLKERREAIKNQRRQQTI
jgi:hypothetical protein